MPSFFLTSSLNSPQQDSLLLTHSKGQAILQKLIVINGTDKQEDALAINEKISLLYGEEGFSLRSGDTVFAQFT